jgi:ABC-type polysaccharide/polyol phosphate export permease
MELFIFGLWPLLALIAAATFGMARTIGFFPALLVCLVFSPFLGVIVCCFFPTHEDVKKENQKHQLQKDILEVLKAIQAK